MKKWYYVNGMWHYCTHRIVQRTFDEARTHWYDTACGKEIMSARFPFAFAPLEGHSTPKGQARVCQQCLLNCPK